MALHRCVLEVERKFRTLAVRELTLSGGTPNFKSLQTLPAQTIRDAYYDRSGLLSATGAWVRKRDGEWQAKLKMGGDYNASRFEEICGADAVAACVRRATGLDRPETENFGLDTVASFATRRQTWIADRDFHVVWDVMDFGHEVGEVELQGVLGGGQGEEEEKEEEEEAAPTEAQKQRAMDLMDERITAFMERYSWAFTPGKPTGKLTAYFELKRS